MHRLAFVTISALPILLASCAPVDSTPAPLTEKQSAKMEKLLKGKIAGEPQSCISNFGNDGLERISDSILVYRPSGGTVYVNTLTSPCPGLASGNDIIVTESFGNQLCRNDFVRLVDRTAGFPGPTCSLGDFVPYRKPKG